MGQKVNPISFRLITSKNWQSRWFSDRNYANLLAEDLLIKQAIHKKLKDIGGISRIEIERTAQELIINIHTSKPGMIIGRSGEGINQLKDFLEKQITVIQRKKPVKKPNWWKEVANTSTKQKLKINIIEIRSPELSATLTAENIARQLEKRIAYRRAVKQTIDKVITKGAKGVKVAVAGRLGGVEIARKEKFSKGSIPLGSLRANVDYAQVDAFTTYGVIGVKVWIYRQDTEEQKNRRT